MASDHEAYRVGEWLAECKECSQDQESRKYDAGDSERGSQDDVDILEQLDEMYDKLRFINSYQERNDNLRKLNFAEIDHVVESLIDVALLAKISSVTFNQLSKSDFIWSEWSSCSATCGLGMRTRTCLNRNGVCPDITEPCRVIECTLNVNPSLWVIIGLTLSSAAVLVLFGLCLYDAMARKMMSKTNDKSLVKSFGTRRSMPISHIDENDSTATNRLKEWSDSPTVLENFSPTPVTKSNVFSGPTAWKHLRKVEDPAAFDSYEEQEAMIEEIEDKSENEVHRHNNETLENLYVTEPTAKSTAESGQQTRASMPGEAASQIVFDGRMLNSKQNRTSKDEYYLNSSRNVQPTMKQEPNKSCFFYEDFKNGKFDEAHKKLAKDEGVSIRAIETKRIKTNGHVDTCSPLREIENMYFEPVVEGFINKKRKSLEHRTRSAEFRFSEDGFSRADDSGTVSATDDRELPDDEQRKKTSAEKAESPDQKKSSPSNRHGAPTANHEAKDDPEPSSKKFLFKTRHPDESISTNGAITSEEEGSVYECSSNRMKKYMRTNYELLRDIVSNSAPRHCYVDSTRRLPHAVSNRASPPTVFNKHCFFPEIRLSKDRCTLPESYDYLCQCTECYNRAYVDVTPCFPSLCNPLTNVSHFPTNNICDERLPISWKNNTDTTCNCDWLRDQKMSYGGCKNKFNAHVASENSLSDKCRKSERIFSEMTESDEIKNISPKTDKGGFNGQFLQEKKPNLEGRNIRCIDLDDGIDISKKLKSLEDIFSLEVPIKIFNNTNINANCGSTDIQIESTAKNLESETKVKSPESNKSNEATSVGSAHEEKIDENRLAVPECVKNNFKLAYDDGEKISQREIIYKDSNIQTENLLSDVTDHEETNESFSSHNRHKRGPIKNRSLRIYGRHSHIARKTLLFFRMSNLTTINTQKSQ